MKPSFANLVTARSGKMTVSLRLPNAGIDSLASNRCGLQLNGGGGNLSLAAGLGDPPGMWVGYVQQHATYGMAEAGETWAASGPFSGCHIAVGLKDGRVYVAHIAQQSGSKADKEWADRKWHADEPWGRWKVPAPPVNFNSCSIVFVDWSQGANPKDISVVRINLKTVRMADFDDGPMEVIDVVHLVNPPPPLERMKPFHGRKPV